MKLSGGYWTRQLLASRSRRLSWWYTSREIPLPLGFLRYHRSVERSQLYRTVMTLWRVLQGWHCCFVAFITFPGWMVTGCIRQSSFDIIIEERSPACGAAPPWLRRVYSWIHYREKLGPGWLFQVSGDWFGKSADTICSIRTYVYSCSISKPVFHYTDNLPRSTLIAHTNDDAHNYSIGPIRSCCMDDIYICDYCCDKINNDTKILVSTIGALVTWRLGLWPMGHARPLRDQWFYWEVETLSSYCFKPQRHCPTIYDPIYTLRTA